MNRPESKTEAYWRSEYQEFKNWIVSSKANNSYKSFAKRQGHKARRNHDKDIIDNAINRLAEEQYLLNEIFNMDNHPFMYI